MATSRGLFLSLIGLCIGASGCLPQGAPPSSAPPPSARGVEPVLTVDADELMAQFRDNVFSASLRFKDKVIRVRGTCGPLGPGPDHRTCLPLPHSHWSTNTVYCYPGDAAGAEWAALKAGDAVTVVGYCRDGGAWDVFLDDCRLEAAGGPK